jgi:hypothetical protein
MAGTSMAAPHVSGALALLMSTGMGNRQAYARLLSTADAQRRMHVDTAVGATGPCGAAPAAAPVAAPPPVRHAPVAQASAVPQPASATIPPPPPPEVTAIPAPRIALPATGRGVAAAAAVGGGHPLLIRLALGLGAVVVVWFVLPRRLLRRLRSG